MTDNLTDVLSFRVSERIKKLVGSYALKFDISVSQYLRDLIARLLRFSKIYTENIEYSNLNPPAPPQAYNNSQIRKAIQTIKWEDKAPRIRANIPNNEYSKSQMDVISEMKQELIRRGIYVGKE